MRRKKALFTWRIHSQKVNNRFRINDNTHSSKTYYVLKAQIDEDIVYVDIPWNTEDKAR